eukprot:3602-Rhodomonas_salina.1
MPMTLSGVLSGSGDWAPQIRSSEASAVKIVGVTEKVVTSAQVRRPPRQSERERHTQTHTQTDRWTDRHTDRHTDRRRQTQSLLRLLLCSPAVPSPCAPLTHLR